MTDAQPQSGTSPEPEQELPLRLSHDEMTRALDQGTARILSPDIDGIIHHTGTWWIEYERGWLRIIDEHVLLDLDRAGRRLAAARAQQEGDPVCSPPHS